MHFVDLREKKEIEGTLFPFEHHHVSTSHPRYVMNYHWHSEIELVLIKKGTLHMTLNENKVEANAGDLVFINGGVLHSGNPENCLYECLLFDLSVFSRLSPACEPYIKKIANRSALVYQHFTADKDDVLSIITPVFDSMRKPSEGYEMAVIGGLYQFFSLVFANHLYLESEPHKSQKSIQNVSRLRAVVDYMDENYSGEVTLAQLAEAASMSPRYFCRFFQKMTDSTPIDYLNRLRIERACYELTGSDNTVTDVAMRCGFNDLSYFIKTFKKYTGTTPGKYHR